MALATEVRTPTVQFQVLEQQEENGGSSDMVQVFMVVRCYSCKTFQVQQVKKTNKWLCKVCNEKQSVVKTYGKGTGKDCRRHVQKLNMLRAKKDNEGDARVETGEHPPQDYANKFSTQDKDADSLDVMEHPVVLGNTKSSRWTAFLSPNEEDEEEMKDQLGDRDCADPPTASKSCIRRRVSDLGTLHCDSQEANLISPYSSINIEANFPAAPSSVSIGTAPLCSAKSMYFSPDRYTKLEEDYSTSCIQSPFSRGMPTNTQSMYNLTSPTSTGNHKEKMEKIKQELQKFSKECKPSKKTAAGRDGIPKVSSRWSQFMCEDDSNSEEEGCKAKEKVSTSASTTHILGTKSTIARYTLDDPS